MAQRSATPVVADPCAVLGRLAGLLGAGADVSGALTELVEAFALRTAVLRSAHGDLVAVAGESLHAVPHTRDARSGNSSITLPVHGRPGMRAASLTVMDARPHQLPALRAAAAILGLALVPAVGAEELLDAAEAERDELADALHDGAVQTLLVARYAADAAVRGADPVVARDAVQEAVVELRRTIWHLRPRATDGLLGSLEQLSAKLTEAGASGLVLHGTVDGHLQGPAAVTAYRLVQAVARRAPGPVSVTLRADDGAVVVQIDGGAPLAFPERWARRAAAVGGDLSCSAGRLRLALPVTATSGIDARTSP